MRAMILAAGEGTRLRPLTQERPKVMLPLGGKPLLEHTLCHLSSQGIREVAINLHYRPEAVVNYFGGGENLGLRLTYSREPKILGTAGALSLLAHYFKSTFLVFYGDILTDLRVAPMLEFHRSRKALATIGVFQVEDPQGYGIVDMDETGRIRRFVEKPPPEQIFSRWANAGIYVLEPEVIPYIPADTFYDFAFHLFPDLLLRGVPIYAYPIQGYIQDIGTPANYRRAQKDLEMGKVNLNALAQH